MYQHRDYQGHVRLSYADIDSNGSISPETELLEVSHYYPFGLKHSGYGHIDNQHGNALAERYNYLNRELESRIGLHHIEADYRHYEPSLGRFSGIDLLSEQMYEQTPYHYGYNNPIVYSDATGLFETRDEAHSFMMAHGYSGRVEFYIDSNGLSGYAVMVEGGAYDGTLYFYNSEILEEIVIEIEKGSKGGGGNQFSWIEQLSDFLETMKVGGIFNVWGRMKQEGVHFDLKKRSAVEFSINYDEAYKRDTGNSLLRGSNFLKRMYNWLSGMNDRMDLFVNNDNFDKSSMQSTSDNGEKPQKMIILKMIKYQPADPFKKVNYSIPRIKYDTTIFLRDKQKIIKLMIEDSLKNIR